MNYQIFTRSRSDKLYSMMAEFLPADKLVRVQGFDGYEESVQYLYHIIENSTADWVINIDEDCFVFDFSRVEKTLKYMQDFGIYDYAGMPDAGFCPHRNFSSTTHNPFFNIFNAKVIREFLKNVDKDEINSRGDFEPFDGFFLWLNESFGNLELTAGQHDDISTTLLNGLIHTWYSREYETDPFHTQRINEAYEYAKSIRVR